MMLKWSVLFSLILCLVTKSNQAQTAVAKIDSLLIGTWNGTSICQVKNSPCHDETVVYHISKKMGVDTFYINASKIVNGVEEEMGILPFIYNKKTNQLTSTAYGIWTFNIEGIKMEGTLLVRGDLYRKIQLYKHY
ncbi:MAG: hypothetical protein JWN76_988 [Chitinophagaceae bacterium]|nr:hypothetical protein [Chitinophagaceae bacterium]